MSDPGLRPPSVTSCKRRYSHPDSNVETHLSHSAINPMPRHDTVVESTNHLNLPRTTTIEFAPNVDPRRGENVMRGRRGRTNSHLPETSFPRTNTGTDTQGIHSVERRTYIGQYEGRTSFHSSNPFCRIHPPALSRPSHLQDFESRPASYVPIFTAYYSYREQTRGIRGVSHATRDYRVYIPEILPKAPEATHANGDYTCLHYHHVSARKWHGQYE